jgi:hypothetical protein
VGAFSLSCVTPEQRAAVFAHAGGLPHRKQLLSIFNVDSGMALPVTSWKMPSETATGPM